MSGSGCGATMVPDDLRHAAYLGYLRCYTVSPSCVFALVLPEAAVFGGCFGWGFPAAVAQAKTLAHNTPASSAQHRRELSILL